MNLKDFIWKRYAEYDKKLLFENEEVLIFTITFAYHYVMIADKINTVIYAFSKDGREYVTRKLSFENIGWIRIRSNNRHLITNIIRKYIDIPRIYFL